MAVELATGDLLDAPVAAYVNAVNCVGVMGKGIALAFKQHYPAMFDAYAAACARGEVAIGRMFVVENVINFPTKQHWRAPSQLAFVRAGLPALVEELRTRGFASVAVPALGCGAGGLAWSEVEPLIRAAFVPLPEVRVLLFAPTPPR